MRQRRQTIGVDIAPFLYGDALLHIPAGKPEDEVARLKILHEIGILDSGGDEIFDSLTRFASDLFKTPIALVSLVDEHRQWFLSRHGIDACETPRSHSFCAHAILNQDEVMVIPDTHLDDRFSDNPLVTGSPGIRFYAGAPIVSDEGHALGSFCIIDTVPRDDFQPSDHEKLKHFAQMTMREIQLWKSRYEAERKLENLRDSQEEQTRILALLGHDMKGSFNAIIGFCGLIARLDPGSDPKKFKEYIDVIGSASYRAHLLMENLMSWARNGLADRDDRRVVTDIRGPVLAALSTVRPTAEFKSIELVDNTQPCVVEIDAPQIEAVIRNLIGNAVKFSNPGGKVMITTTATEDSLTLSVEDQGMGMDAATLEKIRNATTAKSKSGTAGEKGSGIGLILSRDFLQSHQSTLQVESTFGKGSTFSFTLQRPSRAAAA